MRVGTERYILGQFAALLLVNVFLTEIGKSDEDWPNYRGPSDQGYFDSAELPLRWSENENVIWKRPIGGKAWSSPVIRGDRIWLTDATEDGTQLSVLCVDKKSGRILLRKQLRYLAAPQYCHPFNSYASPSPVLDEEHVYVSFGSPCNACLDAKTGEVVWQREDFVCNHFRGAGSSPLVYRNLVILHFDGSDRQYVVALDKRSGKTVWKTDRTVDFKDLDPSTSAPTREGDYRKAFSTPIVVEVDEQPVLISLGSMALYGYAPDTGKELWRVESVGSHSGSCRPVFGHGLVFSPTGYTGEIWAVRPEGRGVVTDSHVVWRHPRKSARRSSFLLADGRLFSVDAAGVAECLDAQTGEEIWKARVGGNHSASPIACHGRIYFFDESGKTTVIQAGPEYKVVAENRLADGCMASPAVSGSALYLRTKAALYRIERSP